MTLGLSFALAFAFGTMPAFDVGKSVSRIGAQAKACA